MRTRLLHPIGALLALLLVAFGAPAAARADGGVGFRVDGEPGSQLDAGFLRFPLAPGGSAAGHFFVTNSGSTGVSLTVYPADGLTGNTTGAVYGVDTDALKETGAWITPGVRSVQVPAGGERRIDFSVGVPGGAASGDHVGAVVMQQARAGTGRSGSVSQVVRNVVPILVDVSGAAGPQIDILNAAITPLPGTKLPAVTVTMRNAGSKICQPLLTVGIRGSGSGKSVTRQLDSVLPGDRAPYALPWPEAIEAGSHIVNVTVSNCGAPDTAAVRSRTPSVLLPGGTENELTTTPTKSRNGSGVETDVTPGTTTFIPAKKKKRGTSQSSGDTKSSGVSGPPVPGGGGSGPSAPAPGSGDPAGGAAKGSGGGGLGHWLSSAAKSVAAAAPDVAKRATIPLALLGLIGLLFFAQEAIDRKDPKLALAPMHREQDLEFDPDPLGGGRGGQVIPLPTGLSTA